MQINRIGMSPVFQGTLHRVVTKEATIDSDAENKYLENVTSELEASDMPVACLPEHGVDRFYWDSKMVFFNKDSVYIKNSANKNLTEEFSCEITDENKQNINKLHNLLEQKESDKKSIKADFN